MASLEGIAASYWRLEKYTRSGYGLEVKMARILKPKDFAGWQVGESCPMQRCATRFRKWTTV
jgi:hypothetical protein